MVTRIRVLFLIPSLVAHGAERQLAELAKAMSPERFEVHVATFYAPSQVEGGDLTPELHGLPHVTLHCLHKRRGLLGNLALVPRLLRLVGRLEPHVIHGYMDGNLPALLAGRVHRARVVWGIRRSNFEPAGMDARSRRALRWIVRLARYTDLVIFNSEAGLRSHRNLGMAAPRMAVIPNGFDLCRFAPDPDSGLDQRQAWGVPEGAPLIGLVARLDPVKGHPLFLEAAARIVHRHPAARFVCIGGGSAAYLRELQDRAQSLGLADRVLWPGATQAMPAAYNALTLLALASQEEGFPNVLGEAMACGIPCVATRVGDAEHLVGPTGRIVPPGDPEALATALLDLLEEGPDDRHHRSLECRARVVGSFGTATLARTTEQALADLLASATPAPLPAEGP
ncbi:MAG TPA: glycosyltransferase [Holophagaceae bacterium]|nr:glycosyltransferase [Holophagaceae bacterium]